MWHTINSEHSTCLQGPEGESMPTFCLDTYLSELAKSNLSQEKLSFKGKETKFSPSSPCGMTCKPSKGNRGGDQLMLFQEDFHAKTFQQQGQGQDWPESVQAYGKSMQDLLEKFCLSLSLPKIPHTFELGDLALSSKTWPRWGMMQDGVCWELGTSAHLTVEIECGFWPTPSARDEKGGHAPASLIRKDGKHRMDILPNVIAYGGKTTQQMKEMDQTSAIITLRINPNWIEWLMGWPIGATDLKPLAMGRFLRWRHLHGGY